MMYKKASDLRAPKLRWIVELAIFAMLGTLMFVSKLVMSLLPNIHIVGVLTVVYTIVFRKKALIPIYVYVFLELFDVGSFLWWVPNLYIWLILWGLAMLIPKRTPLPVAAVLCVIICGFHGFAYGTLWAPVQAVMFSLSFEQMLTWIAFGLPFDITHGISNLALGTLIIPLSVALRSALKSIR